MILLSLVANFVGKSSATGISPRSTTFRRYGIFSLVFLKSLCILVNLCLDHSKQSPSSLSLSHLPAHQSTRAISPPRQPKEQKQRPKINIKNPQGKMGWVCWVSADAPYPFLSTPMAPAHFGAALFLLALKLRSSSACCHQTPH